MITAGVAGGVNGGPDQALLEVRLRGTTPETPPSR
jgi:hypothetical protein